MKKDSNIGFDQMKYFISTCLADTSHSYGNMVKSFETFLLKQFPENYFKKVHVSTQIALRQMRSLKTILQMKKTNPFLSISPRINTDRTEALTNSTELLFGTNVYDMTRPKYASNQCKFYKDVHKGIFVDYNITRTHMDFDIKLILSEEYQQFNVWNHMRQQMRWEVPFFLPVTTEVVIPDVIIKRISKDAEMPIFDDRGSVIPFMEYLNTYSTIPIVYKMETSKSQKRFFMVLEQDVIIRFDNLSMDSGNMNGHTKEDFGISASAYIEFNHPGTYYYIALNEGEKDDDPVNKGEFDMVNNLGNKIELQYTFDRRVISQFYDGKQSWQHVNFQVDSSDDAIDITSILDGNVIDLANEYLESDNNPSDIYDIRIHEEGKEVDKDRFYIDYKESTVCFIDFNPAKYYLMSIYVCNKKYNAYKLRKHSY